MLKKIICLTVLTVLIGLVCFYYTSASGIDDEQIVFDDVHTNDWFYENIINMTELGLLEGYGDNTFRPNNEITNCEFITVVDKALNGAHNNNIQGEHWAKEVMDYALSKSWYDYDEIPPGNYDVLITRELAVKVIMQSMIPHKTGDYIKYPAAIKDYQSINGRYSDLVIRAYTQGIVTGDENGNFNPKSRLTRAEACALINRAMSYNQSENTSVNSDETKPNSSVNQESQVNVIPQSPAQNETTSSVGAGNGVSENGRLSVSGTKLVNERGEAVQLRGMSSHGIQWYDNFTNYNSIKNTADFGANLFRVAMYTAENGYIQNRAVKEKVYNAVDCAINLNMYVIIDWHILSDGNPRTYENEAKEFFAEVSQRYKGNPAVIYEICNEPNGNVSWDNDIKPYAESVIPVIRANDENAVILVGSGTWSQDFDKAADNPLNFSNVMYTCHFYSGTHGKWLRDRIDYAVSKGAAIFVSEWGTSRADGSGGVFLNEAYDWLVFLNERQISWANWSLCDKNETSAALRNGTSPDEVWTIDNLTESGKFVFSNFR